MRSSTYTADKQTIIYRRTLKKISRFLNKYLYLIILTDAVWCSLFYQFDIWDGQYMDADGYMRALRLYHLILNPSFAEQPIFESNYPFGEYLHWTRPMDILWLLSTLPFLHLTDLKDIIYMGGALLAPLLSILTILAVVYGLRRQFNIFLTCFASSLYLDYIANSYLLSPKRPDHHALMILLGLYATSLILCWLKKRHNRYLRLLGLTFALMIFTVADGFLLYVLFLTWFVGLYVFKNIALLPAVKISKYAALALSLFWLLNPPHEGWFYPDNGRISILYVTVAWFIFVSLKIIDLSRLHTKRLKLMCLACTALGALLLLVVIFGTNILRLPVDPELHKIFNTRIAEMDNICRLPWYRIIAQYGAPFLALLVNLYMLRFRPYQRLMSLNLCLGLPLFVLALFFNRFGFYISFYIFLPYIALMDHLYKKSAFSKNMEGEFPAHIYIIALAALGCPYIMNIPYTLTEHPVPIITRTPAMEQNVRQIGGTLLTDVFLSPEYIWYSNVNTVGTPYHRNREGIIETHKILNSETDNDIIPLLLKHQITQILLFENYDNITYSLTEENSKKLYYRLLKGENLPAYLQPVPAPLKGARHYLVRI